MQKKAVEKDGSAALLVRFPAAVYDDLRRIAFDEHVSMTALVVRAVRRFLGRTKKREET